MCERFLAENNPFEFQRWAFRQFLAENISFEIRYFLMIDGVGN
jgi:hypothetical protein